MLVWEESSESQVGTYHSIFQIYKQPFIAYSSPFLSLSVAPVLKQLRYSHIYRRRAHNKKKTWNLHSYRSCSVVHEAKRVWHPMYKLTQIFYRASALYVPQTMLTKEADQLTVLPCSCTCSLQTTGFDFFYITQSLRIYCFMAFVRAFVRVRKL